MALGGGTFVTQNKVIPGSYINFATKSSGNTVLGERGTVALGTNFEWAPDGIIEITADDFYKNSMKLFGFAPTHDVLIGIRDVLKNAEKIYVYRINNSGGSVASCAYGSAKYKGARGNDIKIAVYSDPDDSSYKNVYTYLGTVIVDTQRVKTITELANNDFVIWNRNATLDNTAGVSMTGGLSGGISGQCIQDFLDAVESYDFDVLTVIDEDEDVSALVSEYTKRMRDKKGIKFQAVVYNYFADYEGIINVDTTLMDYDDCSILYWVAGAAAGCQINESLTNKVYDGEFKIYNSYTQSELENKIKAGVFVFQKSGGEMRVLRDINSLVSTSTEKGVMFQNNQTVRICDRIAEDASVLFEQNYLGKVPNDTAGRNSLWADLVKYHQKLVNMRALDQFEEDDISVEQGESKNSVVIYEKICPVNSMELLYMMITLE